MKEEMPMKQWIPAVMVCDYIIDQVIDFVTEYEDVCKRTDSMIYLWSLLFYSIADIVDRRSLYKGMRMYFTSWAMGLAKGGAGEYEVMQFIDETRRGFLEELYE